MKRGVWELHWEKWLLSYVLRCRPLMLWKYLQRSLCQLTVNWLEVKRQSVLMMLVASWEKASCWSYSLCTKPEKVNVRIRLKVNRQILTKVMQILIIVSSFSNTSPRSDLLCVERDVKSLLTHSLLVIPGGAKKMSRTFACIIQPSGQNESAQKHVCDDQTSPNMCRNFLLKLFCISCDTNRIASHAIKQFLQAAHHLHCRLYADYTKTSQ